MNRWLAPLAGLVVVAGMAGQGVTEVRGTLGLETRWSGTIRLVADVTVPSGGTLEIAPGTTILVAASDAGRGGWNPALVEVHVEGLIQALGELERPIVWRSESPKKASHPRYPRPEEASWHGVTLRPIPLDVDANRRHVFRSVRFQHAFSGVQVPEGNPLFEDCVFLRCGVGVEVGSAYRDKIYRGLRPASSGLAGPELRRCRMANCRTGVYAERGATPRIERSVFYRCRAAMGSNRPGVLSHLREPGCTVERCAVIECGSGIHGCAVVRESLFVDTSVAATLSSYHDRLATRIDYVVFEDNVISGCDVEIQGDSAVARDSLRGQVRFAGDLAPLLGEWPPLPECLALGSNSAGIGAARDGSDLGPVATLREGRAGDAAKALGAEGVVLRSWYGAATPVPRGFGKRTKVELGRKVGSSWWSRLDSGADGSVSLRPALNGATSGVLAAVIDASAAKNVSLQWSGDVARLAVFVNGRSVHTTARKRRFGALEPAISFSLAAGRNVILMSVEAWTADPKLLVTLDAMGWQPLELAATEPDDVTVKGKRKRKGKKTFVELTFSAPPHWCPVPGESLAAVRIPGKGQDPKSASAEWFAHKRLRIGPLPEEYRKGPLEVSFPGLRDATGKPLSLAPVRIQ